jgi:hypothetical protein
MADTVRVFWRNAQSGWFNFNWDGVIGQNSVVHISACECSFPEDNLSGAEGVVRTRGDAAIYVKNIRPHGPNPGQAITGGVEFILQVDWGTPLNVATDITVVEDPVGKVIV